jgi:hypothetical protein
VGAGLAAATWTTVSGRKLTALPRATAMRVWTMKASPTPIHTKSGRNLVDSTRVAMKVLSGSSTTKMAAKVSATTRRSTREA